MQQKKDRPLSESLAEEGIISAEQLKRAKEEERRSGTRLRKALVKLGFISEEDLVAFMSEKMGIPRVELDNYLIDSKIVELVPEELARKYELMPVLKIGNRLTCAMVDPWNVFALDELRSKSGLIVEPAIATEGEIKQALTEHYGTRGSMDELVKEMDKKKFGDRSEKEGADSEGGESDGAVVIKIVNSVIMNALRQGASDIHIEPEDDKLNIRFRVDGILHEASSPPKYLQSAFISRIKIMANLDIAEKRIPQDGRFTMRMEAREIDIRVSSFPTINGENVVLRLLDTANLIMSPRKLGFSEEVLKKYSSMITKPHGIILVTGPTGSGKTTTIYASLSEINSVEKNVITIEDPVEYKIEGIRQTQVNPKVNLTFANGLRSILRQDPDIIMVGEIRDLETLEIAIHAALTGHLVFSTLHTNDAPGAVTRMVDMGAEPFLISSAVIGILAQRLVRTVCPECKKDYKPSGEELKETGMFIRGQKGDIIFYKGTGCKRCMGTGYKGRIGIYELMPITGEIKDLTVKKSPAEEIRKTAVSQGMRGLKEDGIAKIEEGLTTIEEVLRVTQKD